MKIWDMIRGKSADIEDIEKKSTAMTVDEVVKQTCEIMRPPLGPRYSDATSVNMYRSWIYVASSHNARAVSSAGIELFTNVTPKVSASSRIGNLRRKELESYCAKNISRNAVQIDSHPILDLLYKPNDDDSLQSFLYKIDLFLELAGDSYVLVNRDSNGIPVSLEVLYSQYVHIQTDGLNKIVAYNYGVAKDGKFDYQFAPEQIIHIKLFDPSDPLQGISPLEAAARSYGLIESMNTYEEAINRNQGVVTGILKHEGKIKPEQRQEIESKWQRKFSSVGRSGKVVVTGSDISYQEIGIAPRDMMFLDGRKWSREEILACYGLPVALVSTEGVNRSNMVEASIGYYKNLVLPRLQLISQTLTRELINTTGINGKDMFIVLSQDAPQDADLNLNKAKLLSKAQAVTVNELRVLLGQQPLDSPLGDEIVNSLGNVTI